MAKSEVITLRISEEIKGKLKKVFGEGVTTSEMIRNTIDSYLADISKAEKGIVRIDLPVNLLEGEDLRNLYNDICELEKKTTESTINLGHEYELDHLKAVQNAKNLLIAHMSIERGREENKKSIKELEIKINEQKEI